MKVGLFIFPVRFASMPPMDIAYLSAYLKKCGHEVYMRDFNVEIRADNDCDTSFWSQQKNQQELFCRNRAVIEKWVEDIVDFFPDFIGISVWECELYFSQEIAKMIKNKRKEIKIIFGGAWCYLQEMALGAMKDGYVDYIVFGEGEMTLAEIIKSGENQESIPGCIRKIDENIVNGGWREENVSPDLLPFPDYSNFDFKKYVYQANYPILFNRGCNWNCSFCSHRAVWRKFRSRSAENIFNEIQQCLLKYPFIRNFYSCDHSMNSNMEQLLKLCDLIIANDIKIESFSGYGQVNSQMLDENIIRKLKQAGFTRWGIGVQSGSDQVLKSMGRPYTASQAEKMLEIMHRHNLVACIDLIVGYPEETEYNFRETINFISRVQEYVSNVSVAPDCSIGYNNLVFYPERYGIHKHTIGENWESSTSTPAIRKERYEIAMEHLASLGVSHRYSDEDRKFLESKVDSKKQAGMI